MRKSNIDVICDSGPLIHLDELDCLALLNDFKSVLIPVQVWKEVAYHRPEALKRSGLSLQKIDVNISSEPAYQTLMRNLSLDLGEQAALFLMRSHSDAIFLTDDAAARLAAVTFGYRVHGTIGIVIRAIRRRQKTKNEVSTILRKLPIHSTLHIRPKLLEEIIAQLEDLK